jgi:DNA-binding NarL/FixJ family response regulator/multidrug efflux pump subunit AcrA (membrane-fusion protein)
MVRIVLVEDQKSIREYVKKMLHTEPSFDVVGMAENGIDGVDLISRLRPDVAVIDIGMPDIDGITLIKIISQRFPLTNILVLSSHSNNEYIYKALNAGAMGYLHKEISPEEMKEAVRLVSKGYNHLGGGLMKKVINQAPTLSFSEHKSDTLEYAPPIYRAESSALLQKKRSDLESLEVVEKAYLSSIDQEELANLVAEKTQKHIGWREIIILFVFAMSATLGIYFIRQRLRSPLPSLSQSEQISNLTKTEFTGKIKPAKVFKIAAPTPSVVEALYVKIGDHVESGQTILSLKNLEAQKTIEQLTQQHQLTIQQQQTIIQQQEAAQQQVLELKNKIFDLNQKETPLATQMAGAELELELAQSQADKVPLPQRQNSIERAQVIYQRAQSKANRLALLQRQGAVSQELLEQAQADARVAKADLEVAQVAAKTSTDLELAKKEKSRIQRQISLNDVQQKRQILEEQLKKANLDYQQASDRLKLIQQQSEKLLKQKSPSLKSFVTATNKGVIVELPVTPGDQIFTGNTLIGLAEMDKMKVEVSVNARLVNALHPGQKAVVRIGAGQELQKFQAKVVSINPLPGENMNHNVELEFSNPSHALLVGQAAAVQFSSEDK